MVFQLLPSSCAPQRPVARPRTQRPLRELVGKIRRRPLPRGSLWPGTATRRFCQTRLGALLTSGCLAALSLTSEAHAQRIPSAPKYQRFELTLKSSRSYDNALQQAEIRVLFISPLGETNRVYGFWDGGRTWRVRYQPNFPGRWTYYTMCSDTANAGLHEQTGEFLCTAATDEHRFAIHGALQVARDQEHFEHADRTPFIWLGDAAWQAAARSSASDWKTYLETRAAQKYNAVQWKLPTTVYSGRERISLNLEVIRQFEAKIEVANRTGLLNAIAPLWEIGVSADDNLPENQAIALLRYCLARWDADHVAWIVAFEADSTGAQAARWQRIGRAVFNTVSHSPVVLLPGESNWVLDNFRQERWVDALGLQTAQVRDEESLPWLLNGPLSLERKKSPARPLLALAPAGESAGAALATTGLSRRLLWWNLLLNTPAGVSYSAQDVSAWTTESGRLSRDQPWFQALTLPGAEAIAPLHDCIAANELWRLDQPWPRSVTAQTTARFPRTQIIAAGSEQRDLVVAYIPEDPAVNLTTASLPFRSVATWVNPRTGETIRAKAVMGSATANFATPAAGDWLLVLKAGK